MRVNGLASKGGVLLISCYELGHQPLALASPLAFLERAGFAPAALDLSVEPFDPGRVTRARFVAISVPMHTALRLGTRVAEEVRRVNPGCHVCFYGLYASLNADYLLANGGDSVLGGEFEAALVALVEALETGRSGPIEGVHLRDHPARPVLKRMAFLPPSRDTLPALRQLGCLFMISAVESLSDTVLANLEKGHTRADILPALRIVRQAGIAFRPTWVAFTPWTTLEDYLDMLDFIEREGLIDHVDPVQLTLRLLVPPGSALLSREAIRPSLGPLDRASFSYRWSHPDPRMDDLQRRASRVVEASVSEDAGATFYKLKTLARSAAGRPLDVEPALAPDRRRPPRLTEAWFC